MAKTAIYKVHTPEGDKIVEAKTATGAINHCIDVSKHYSAKALNASELAEEMKKGKQIEVAA